MSPQLAVLGFRCKQLPRNRAAAAARVDHQNVPGVRFLERLQHRKVVVWTHQRESRSHELGAGIDRPQRKVDHAQLLVGIAERGRVQSK